MQAIALLYGVPFFESRLTASGMLSLVRVTPASLKSPPSPQLSKCSAFGKRATFTAVFVDTSNSPVDDSSSVGICHLQAVNFLTVDAQRPPLLARSPSVRNISDTENNSPTSAETSSSSTTSPSALAPDAHPCSIFPVYGPFDLLHCLQTGGFAAAWAAKDRSTGKLLCLKVFQSIENPHVSRSVRTELAVFRRIVKSRGGEIGKQFIMELNRSMQHDLEVFFAMELMSTDLSSYFCAEPERCKLHARRWTAQIALGIQSLHEMAIIHRDIKTENILIDSRENVRIIDYGLAYLGCASKPLRAIEFLGTPPYMAPEVWQNMDLPADRRMYYGIAVDWWALGCILYELESRDHQLLFDNEEDVYAYIDWTQGPGKLGETYPGFEGFNHALVNILEGLLQVQPSARFSLKDMEKHVYFLCRNGTSEFDNAAARARARPIRPELVPQFGGNSLPVKVIEAAKAVTPNDWANLKWALEDV